MTLIVLDGQRLGMAENIASDVAGDRESDLDVVVQRYIVERVAELALKAWMNLVELAKTAGNLRAIGADEQPIHLEQTHLGGVHKQLDCLRFARAARGGVFNGIDAKKLIIIGGTDIMLQSRENVRSPGPCRCKIGQALPQEAFVDKRRLIHLIYPPHATDEADRPHTAARGTAAERSCDAVS